MKRTITELIDLKTGIHHLADEILVQPERKVISLRRDLAERAKQHRSGIKNAVFLACSICTQPVRLAGMPTGEFYFKHDNDSGDCPIKTSGKYSQREIDTMRYNGAKESRTHLELKCFIAAILKQDARFSDVEVEKTIKSKGFSKSWKRPDVSSAFNKNTRIVFEIQLSTTFLNVIIDRENFYKNEQTYIMWLFNSFSRDGIRFTEKDIQCE